MEYGVAIGDGGGEGIGVAEVAERRGDALGAEPIGGGAGTDQHSDIQAAANEDVDQVAANES
jgi:hypothetical protein